MIRVVPIDLSRGERHDHPDFKEDSYYLAIWNGEPHFGRFRRVWFGWHFACGWGASGGFQFDTPGYNNSPWESLYEVQGLKLRRPRALRRSAA